MDFQSYWFAIILLAILAIPLWYFLKDPQWFLDELKFMIPAMFISGAVFLIINARMFKLGVFQYNPNYLLGKNLFRIPVEEWLFLLVVSLLMFAVYNFLKERFSSFDKPNLFLSFALVLLVVFGLSSWFIRQRFFPFSIFALLTVYLGYTVFRNRFKQHFTKFFTTWMILAVPVFILRVLYFSKLVIIPDYNFTSGINLFSVPIEDLAYFFMLFLMNITVYEYVRERRLF